MKTFTLAAALFICLTGFSQDLKYEVRGRYQRPVKKEKLEEARFLGDFISGYPTNWITEYVSVEISATCNGKSMKAVSLNDFLSPEQRNILKTADLSTPIVLDVKYKYRNPANGIMENNNIHTSVAVVPEIEAEYTGGREQMLKYLKENAIDKISSTIPEQFQQLVIFTINEEGKIVNARITMASKDPGADKLLMEAINKMPRWKPAENSEGVKVKQEFEFAVGNGGC